MSINAACICGANVYNCFHGIYFKCIIFLVVTLVTSHFRYFASASDEDDTFPVKDAAVTTTTTTSVTTTTAIDAADATDAISHASNDVDHHQDERCHVVSSPSLLSQATAAGIQTRNVADSGSGGRDRHMLGLAENQGDEQRQENEEQEKQEEEEEKEEKEEKEENEEKQGEEQGRNQTEEADEQKEEHEEQGEQQEQEQQEGGREEEQREVHHGSILKAAVSLVDASDHHPQHDNSSDNNGSGGSGGACHGLDSVSQRDAAVLLPDAHDERRLPVGGQQQQYLQQHHYPHHLHSHDVQPQASVCAGLPPPDISNE